MVGFLNADHKANYSVLRGKYPQVDKASDYRAACYILALPDVFSLMGEITGGWIFEWCYDTVTVEVKEDDEWDYQRAGRYYRRDIPEDEFGDLITGQRFAGLSGGARRLVYAAMNLYNGSKGFDLSDGLSSWDDHLFKAFLNACIVRKGGKLGDQ